MFGAKRATELGGFGKLGDLGMFGAKRAATELKFAVPEVWPRREMLFGAAGCKLGTTGPPISCRLTERAF